MDNYYPQDGNFPPYTPPQDSPQPYNQSPNQPYDQPFNQAPQQFTPMYSAPIDRTNNVMSVGEYIGMFIISSIPVLNIICWIIWLCSSNTNKNKKNYIIATIIMSVITFIIFAIIGIIIVATGASIMDLDYYF